MTIFIQGWDRRFYGEAGGGRIKVQESRQKFRLSDIALTYVGAIVGAGFASGQELVRFFAVHGQKGFYGIALSALLLGVFPAEAVRLFGQPPGSGRGVLRYSLAAYESYLWIYLFGGLCVMLSGSRMVFGEYLGLSPEIGGIVMGAGIALTLLGKTQAFLRVNGVLVPFLIIVGLYVCAVAFLNSPVESLACLGATLNGVSLVPESWIASSILYVSYNLPLGMTVLMTVGGSKRRLTQSALLGVAWLSAMMFMFLAAILRQGPDVIAEEAPMLRMASDLGPLIGYVYATAMWIAMFTTALAETHGLIQGLFKRVNIPFQISIIAVLGTAYPLSRYGFSEMVAKVYPLLGYLALPFTVLIAVNAVASISLRPQASSGARPHRQLYQP
jgi:uncharacterized membrane protein YkvI